MQLAEQDACPNVRRTARERELARLRQVRRRARVKFEARVAAQMARYGVDGERAIKQLTPTLTPAASAYYTVRRKAGTLPRWEPGRARGFVPARRPRDRRRAPGTTPEARARAVRRAALERRDRLEERRAEREARRSGLVY